MIQHDKEEAVSKRQSEERERVVGVRKKEVGAPPPRFASHRTPKGKVSACSGGVQERSWSTPTSVRFASKTKGGNYVSACSRYRRERCPNLSPLSIQPILKSEKSAPSGVLQHRTQSAYFLGCGTERGALTAAQFPPKAHFKKCPTRASVTEHVMVFPEYKSTTY